MTMEDLLRLLIALALVMHGVSHAMWFLASWTPYKLGIIDGTWIFPGEVRLTGRLGHIIGIAALVALGLFAFAALGLVLAEPWWRGAAQYGAYVSIVVALPWWPWIPRRIGLWAIVADIVVLLLVALPVSVEIIARA